MALLRDGTVGDRAAIDVLAERLAQLPHPELVLFGSAVMENMIGPALWLVLVGGKGPGEDEPSFEPIPLGE
jgi:hypothetical protein